jgi:hypothetical protein
MLAHAAARAADKRTAAKEKRAASLRPEFREETSAKADHHLSMMRCTIWQKFCHIQASVLAPNNLSQERPRGSPSAAPAKLVE